MIRKLIPYSLVTFYRRCRRQFERKKAGTKTTKEIFSKIYRTNQWGGKPGEFNSGGGTTDDQISAKYIDCITEIAERENFHMLRAVDLGCGDMRIGSEIAGLFRSYIGVDIVDSLIAHHRAANKNKNISFECINIIEDELPDGDVCFVRQVLQHLSNDQIIQIIPKLSKYRYVYVSEHLPKPNKGVKYNLDKPHGGDIRLYDNSGVYLTESPFNIEKPLVNKVLEVEGHGYENYSEDWIKGIIETIEYIPNANK